MSDEHTGHGKSRLGSGSTDLDYRRRIEAAIAYIDTNLAGDLSLKVLARETAFSEYHFARVFSAMEGEPPASYVRRRRLERAASRLLVDPIISVARLADEAGYPSPSSFSRAFKNRFGSSPEEFRTGPRTSSTAYEPPRLTPPYSRNAIEAVSISEYPRIACVGRDFIGAYDHRLISAYRKVLREAMAVGAEPFLLYALPLDPPHITEASLRRYRIGIGVAEGAALLPLEWSTVSRGQRLG